MGIPTTRSPEAPGHAGQSSQDAPSEQQAAELHGGCGETAKVNEPVAFVSAGQAGHPSQASTLAACGQDSVATVVLGHVVLGHVVLGQADSWHTGAVYGPDTLVTEVHGAELHGADAQGVDAQGVEVHGAEVQGTAAVVLLVQGRRSIVAVTQFAFEQDRSTQI